MIVGFDPIVGKDAKVMILGSMPSATSLKKQEYYGYKYNRFWKIMHHVFAMPIDTYEQKKQIIIQNHMILWDVIHACDREGSLDSAIQNEIVNPIDILVKQHPGIHLIICNGRKSYDLYQKFFGKLPVAYCYLPSTSNANRSLKEEVLFEEWSDVLKDNLL